MKQLVQFIHNHWQLALALVAVVVWLIIEEMKYRVGGAGRLRPHDVVQLMNHEDAVVVDLRTQNLFLAGHILKAINIPLADLDAHLSKITAHKDKPIILVADTDANALLGAKKLKTDCPKVYILAGGIVAWKDAHLPLAK